MTRTRCPDLGETRIAITPGAVRVNSAHVVARGDDVAAIEVDCSTKRAQLACITSDEGRPQIVLEEGQQTLQSDESKRGEITLVTFLDFSGFDVWSCNEHARYTFCVCLVRRPE